MSHNTSFVPVPFSCVYSSEAPRSANLVWLNMNNLNKVEFVSPHITTLLKMHVTKQGDDKPFESLGQHRVSVRFPFHQDLDVR